MRPISHASNAWKPSSPVGDPPPTSITVVLACEAAGVITPEDDVSSADVV